MSDTWIFPPVFLDHAIPRKSGGLDLVMTSLMFGKQLILCPSLIWWSTSVMCNGLLLDKDVSFLMIYGPVVCFLGDTIPITNYQISNLYMFF